jgi:hypothetical protein
MKKFATSSSLWFVVMLAAPLTAEADILDYDCAVGDLKLSIHVDTETLTVRQTAALGSTTEVVKYSDGVFGIVSHTGNATLIPSIHQFVRITEDFIYYGGELQGIEDGAVVNRRLATIVLPSGKGGWCSLLSEPESK